MGCKAGGPMFEESHVHLKHVKDPTTLIENNKGPSQCEWTKLYSLISGHGAMTTPLVSVFLDVPGTNGLTDRPETQMIPEFGVTTQAVFTSGKNTARIPCPSTMTHTPYLPVPKTQGIPDQNHKGIRGSIICYSSVVERGFVQASSNLPAKESGGDYAGPRPAANCTPLPSRLGGGRQERDLVRLSLDARCHRTGPLLDTRQHRMNTRHSTVSSPGAAGVERLSEKQVSFYTAVSVFPPWSAEQHLTVGGSRAVRGPVFRQPLNKYQIAGGTVRHDRSLAAVQKTTCLPEREPRAVARRSHGNSGFKSGNTSCSSQLIARALLRMPVTNLFAIIM
ncbi:hypothetical protein Bbelb_305090 [Branchiostoma belcheri]|nr:hypothetical protein Bbelb_305090 [Branchiostoma belcheri]